MVRFTKFQLQFPHHSSIKKEQNCVKNQFDQSIKQSSNLILRSIVWEFDSLVKEFNKAEATSGRKFLFQVVNVDDPEDIGLVLESILPTQELQSCNVEQLLEWVVRILNNKVDHVQEVLFDALSYILRLMKNWIL
jgi:hypothetical protein